MSYFDYSKIDVEDYINELGMNNVSLRGDQVWFSCPLPQHIGADKTPSASMELGTTRMHCFGCGFSGNAVSFLAELEGVSRLTARRWLRDRFEMGFFEPKETFADEINLKLSRQEKRLNEIKQRNTSLHFTLLDEEEVEKRNVDWHRIYRQWNDRIDDSAYPLAYMLDRGFHPTTLEKWAIGWDMISQRISIPVRDEYGNLIGFKGRATDNNPQRYKVLGGPEYGFDTYSVSKVLFGLDRVKRFDSLIVREGELNCIALHQAGYDNSVGCGKILSDTQLELIKKYANRNVIYWFDDHSDAMNARAQTEMYIPSYTINYSKYDPSDMSDAEIKRAIDKFLVRYVI